MLLICRGFCQHDNNFSKLRNFCGGECVLVVTFNCNKLVSYKFSISSDKMYVPKKENAENICVLGNGDYKKNYGLKFISYCDREKEDIFGVFKKSLSDSHLLNLSILKEVNNFNTLCRSYIFLHVSVLYLFNSLP